MGFPLVKAANSGYLDMIRLLLDYGADINAKSPTQEQRELGAPIMLAFEQRRYDIVRLLLDRGASVAAYGWCYPCLVDLVYQEALREGSEKQVARRAFDSYLGPSNTPTIVPRTDEASRLFERLLDLGGQMSMGAIVEFRYYDLAEQLLKHCPNEPATKHDCPPGTVLESLCWSAAWHGIPQVLDLAMHWCIDLFTTEMSIAVLRSAIKSHNRVGLASEYLELIETQLKYLRDQQVLQSVIASDEFLPHFLLAEDYLWPGWYGNEKDPSSVKSMIELSELFIRYGFDDVNRVDSQTQTTALDRAKSRADHPSLTEYAAYLKSIGGS